MATALPLGWSNAHGVNLCFCVNILSDVQKRVVFCSVGIESIVEYNLATDRVWILALICIPFSLQYPIAYHLSVRRTFIWTNVSEFWKLQHFCINIFVWMDIVLFVSSKRCSLQRALANLTGFWDRRRTLSWDLEVGHLYFTYMYWQCII